MSTEFIPRKIVDKNTRAWIIEADQAIPDLPEIPYPITVLSQLTSQTIDGIILIPILIQITYGNIKTVAYPINKITLNDPLQAPPIQQVVIGNDPLQAPIQQVVTHNDPFMYAIRETRIILHVNIGQLPISFLYSEIPMPGVGENSDFKSNLLHFIDDPTYTITTQVPAQGIYAILLIFNDIMKFYTEPFIEDAATFTTGDLQDRSTSVTCGFTSQINALIFCSIMIFIDKPINTLLFFDVNGKSKNLSHNDFITITNGCRYEPRNMLPIHAALQSLISPYSISGRQRLLSLIHQQNILHIIEDIKPNITYIFTFYTITDNLTDVEDTTHHFCFFPYEESDEDPQHKQCIIVDSWCGSGSRTNWARIMNTQIFLNLIKLIHTTDDINMQRKLINLLFYVPYSDESLFETEQEKLYRVFIFEVSLQTLQIAASQPIVNIGGRKNKSRKRKNKSRKRKNK